MKTCKDFDTNKCLWCDDNNPGYCAILKYKNYLLHSISDKVFKDYFYWVMIDKYRGSTPYINYLYLAVKEYHPRFLDIADKLMLLK